MLAGLQKQQTQFWRNLPEGLGKAEDWWLFLKGELYRQESRDLELNLGRYYTVVVASSGM